MARRARFEEPVPAQGGAAGEPVALTDLMEDASAALAEGRYFDCERIADEALHRAWQRLDYAEMARIVLPLQEARRQRRLAAVAAGKVHVIDQTMPAPGSVLKAGVYVVTAPMVGADAMQIRHAALAQKTPVVALAVEPVTKLGFLPVVSVGPIVVRTRVDRPAKFTGEWALEAIENLGLQAIEAVDVTRPLGRQIDQLMDGLDAVPECEGLHQRLMETCISAARQPTNISNPPEATELTGDDGEDEESGSELSAAPAADADDEEDEADAGGTKSKRKPGARTTKKGRGPRL